jgi:hypothetical protein
MIAVNNPTAVNKYYYYCYYYKCSYQTKLSWKMGPILQYRINTSMFLRFAGNPVWHTQYFLRVAYLVRPIFSSQPRFALIFYVMRLHRLNKYKKGCNCTKIHLQLIIVNYTQVWPIKPRCFQQRQTVDRIVARTKTTCDKQNEIYYNQFSSNEHCSTLP